MEPSQEDLSICLDVWISDCIRNWIDYDEPGCLPLRVHLDQSIFSSAIGSVIYQTGLSPFIYWIQPRTQLKQSLQIISQKVPKKFRLSCFLCGKREIEEIGSVD
jgi:hypothetical protein